MTVNMMSDYFAKIKKYTRLINKHLTNTGNRVIIVLKEKKHDYKFRANQARN